MKLLLKILFLVLPLTAFASNSAQDLSKLLANIKTMQADFAEVSASGNSHVKRQTTGKMALLRPGKFRWEVLTPSKQLIVTNGEVIWIYDVDLEQVSKHQVDPHKTNNPAVLLSGSMADIERDFIIRKRAIPKENKISGLAQIDPSSGGWFELTPRDQQNSPFQEVQLHFVDGKIHEMQVIDNLGQKSVLLFFDVKTNLEIPAKLFIFKVPRGVDVV